MSDVNGTTPTGEARDSEIPVLTEIIDDGDTENRYAEEALIASTQTSAASLTVDEPVHDSPPVPNHASLVQIEAELVARLSAELALQVPVLLESALREHLPKAIGAKLQAELLTALANALPGAAQNAAAELSSTLAFEVGGMLEERLGEEVRRAVADEIARLSSEDQRLR
jgi:hypothetical protein